MIRDFPQQAPVSVPLTPGNTLDNKSGHYLDYNATAPLRDEAWQAMQQAAGLTGNPSSTHRSGQAARKIVEDARQILAAALGAAPVEVILTSGGTESNNLAMQGLVGCVHRVLVSEVEHDSVLQAVRHVRGVSVEMIPVTGRGVVDLTALHALLQRDQGENFSPTLVSVMLVNNETGVIQPLDDIVTLAHAHGAYVHVDAVQAIGKIPVSFRDLGVDLMTVSAHKCGGPQGIGALMAREGLPLAPQMHGGRQELGRRAGTESPLLVAGFAAAVERAVGELMTQDSWPMDKPSWQQTFESRIKAIAPDVVIFGEHALRVPTTSCFAAPGFSSESQIMALNWDDVYISAGAACSSGKIRPSHVLRAMGVAEDLARCAVRVSWGYATTFDAIEHCLASWERAYQRRRSLSAQPVPAAQNMNQTATHPLGFVGGSQAESRHKAVQGSVL